LTETPTYAGENLSAWLREQLAPELDQLRGHPWLAAAVAGDLLPQARTTWAQQDLLWGNLYMPVLTAAAAAAPEPAARAFAWLDTTLDDEIAWFRAQAAGGPLWPGGDQIWMSYLGYAHWMRDMAAVGHPRDRIAASGFRALVIATFTEGSYHDWWAAIRDLRTDLDPAAATADPGDWLRWSIRNWAGKSFADMMADLYAGLDAAHAAGDPLTAPARAADALALARRVYQWEAGCWTSMYAGRSGWAR
jgi:hypothetical protein